MRLITLSQISGDSSYDDMFDEFVGTQTEMADEIEQTFSIAGFNCVAILNNEGIEATLEVDGITQTISLIRDSIKDWWDYWFGPSRRGRDCVFYFPMQTSGDATLTISYPDSTAKCGMAVTGVALDIATTLQGVGIGITDYSKVITNEFGDTYFNPGNWAKRASADLHIGIDSVDIAYREIVKNRGVACIFDYNEYAYSLTERHTSEDGYQSLIVYGYTEDFKPSIMPTYVTARHESQGLI